MKTPRISDALNQVDDDIVSGASRAKKSKKNNWLKWCIIAACFILILVAMFAIIPMFFENNDSVISQSSGEGVQKDNFVIPQDSESGNGNNTAVLPPDNGSVGNEGDGSVAFPNNGTNDDDEAEFQLESYYDFEINSDIFTDYISGKVIDVEKVGTKFKSVTVTGGWKNATGLWISTEALNAEVYEINGVEREIAVALRFIDQPEGATNTHYYVMINPNMDLSDVEEYVRDPIGPNNPGDEIGNEHNE